MNLEVRGYLALLPRGAPTQLSTSDVDLHNFVLVLSGVTEPDGQLEDGLFEAGCDDATLAFRNGIGYIEFDRRAPSLDAAIQSAVQDVERADDRLSVVSVEMGRSS